MKKEKVSKFIHDESRISKRAIARSLSDLDKIEAVENAREKFNNLRSDQN